MQLPFALTALPDQTLPEARLQTAPRLALEELLMAVRQQTASVMVQLGCS